MTAPFDDGFDDGSDVSDLSKRFFTWILDDQVLAMGRPGPGDLMALGTEGVTRVISLTLSPLPDRYFDNCDIVPVHLPLPDMSAPSLQDIRHFVEILTFGPDVDCIQWYNGASKTWHFMGPNDYFVPGRGYWIHTTDDCQWEVPL